MKGIKIK